MIMMIVIIVITIIRRYMWEWPMTSEPPTSTRAPDKQFIILNYELTKLYQKHQFAEFPGLGPSARENPKLVLLVLLIPWLTVDKIDDDGTLRLYWVLKHKSMFSVCGQAQRAQARFAQAQFAPLRARRVLLTEIPLPRNVRQRTACLIQQEDKLEKLELW